MTFIKWCGAHSVQMSEGDLASGRLGINWKSTQSSHLYCSSRRRTAAAGPSILCERVYFAVLGIINQRFYTSNPFSAHVLCPLVYMP
jgi:hypothetical protein